MKFEYNGQIIGSTPHYLKKSIGEETVILNDEYEAHFFKTNGANNYILWNSLSDMQKKAYKNFESIVDHIYSECIELFTKYHTDLEFYALMYRNIPLYNLALDAYSMMFFASKKDEIIGYHTRILNSCSDKAKIVKLYYDNKVLFPKACKKHLNIDLFNNTMFCYNFTEEIIQNFSNNHIPTVMCVDALSSDDCKAILNAKQQIQNDYKNIIDKAPWMYDGFRYKGQPNFRNRLLEGIMLYREIIDRFLLEHGFPAFDKDIDKIKQYEEKKIQMIREEYHLFAGKIAAVIGEKSAEQAVQNWSSLTEVKNALVHLNQSIQLQKNIVIPLLYFSRTTQQRMESVSARVIETLKKELQIIIEKIDKAKEEVLQFGETTESVKIIRNNNDAINTYINRSFEKQYDEMWLQKKDFIRNLEANFADVDCFITFIRHQDLKLRAIERRKTIDKKNIMKYSSKQMFTNWYAPIKEEKERLTKMEQMRREEELRQKQERLRIELEQRKREEEARQAQFRYNQQNKHIRDSLLTFNKEKHTYLLNGRELDSVTTLVNNSFPKFNTEEHAKHVAARNGMTIHEVLDMWEKKGKQSREQGTLLHHKIEKYYQGIDSQNDPAFQLFKQFASKFMLKPYRTEWSVYDKDLGIAGTIDYVDYQNGEYSIYDWKRSDKLIANGLPAKINQYGEKGYYPLEHLDNSPYYHYALQLSIYKYILERNYGIKIEHLRLGIFHPTYTKPYLLEIPYLGNEVVSLFNLRSEILL